MGSSNQFHASMVWAVFAALSLTTGCQTAATEGEVPPVTPGPFSDVTQSVDVGSTPDIVIPDIATPPDVVADAGPDPDATPVQDMVLAPDTAPEPDIAPEPDATQQDVEPEPDVAPEPDAAPEPVCGDGACEEGETAESCPDDCDLTDPLSCADKCGVYDEDAACQCDSYCDDLEDCCDDVCDACPEAPGLKTHCGLVVPDSCVNRCGLYDGEAPCQCDPACKEQEDCCDDLCEACSDQEIFESLCANTCAKYDTCGSFEFDNECQCDDYCLLQGDCCLDYCDTCGNDELCEETVDACGDGDCSGAETSQTCPADCGTIITCGDSVCEGFEDPLSCPEDCKLPSFCGNSVCEPGEDFETCALDCIKPPTCGDGTCNGDETFLNCSEDCPFFDFCGDGICTGNESPANCIDDCPFMTEYCGNGICAAEESPGTCWKDCISPCGDGICMSGWPNQDETWKSCPQDCPGGCGECYADFECSYGEGNTTFCVAKSTGCDIPTYYDPSSNAEYFGWCASGSAGPTITVLCGQDAGSSKMWSYDCNLTGQVCEHVYKGSADGKSYFGPECVDP